MTPPKRWPNDCDFARTQSIALCNDAIEIIKEISNRDLSILDIMRRLIRVVDILRQVQTILRKVGPREPSLLKE